MHHKLVQVIRDMNVCKHLFYHLMKKETFHCLQLKAHVCICIGKFFFKNLIYFFLGLFSNDDTRILDSRDNLKSMADTLSIERTRKDKFRHAVRTVSKVAFSQLGLGKLTIKTTVIKVE